MAVKAIENITTTVTNPSHQLLSLGICSTLWYLFTHSSGDAVKVAAVSRAWAELGPRSSSTCSQYWQLPCSPHATTCNDSPRRLVLYIEREVVSAILPPLTKLVFSKSVEVPVFVLRVLSELSLLLLGQESAGTEESHEANAKDGKKEERSQIINVFNSTLFPRYESLLKAAEPIPLYALKLLVSMTEHSTQICRYCNPSSKP
ncbi:unnamed protein product [Tetraodon nigroviridis]|uniref:(spotted green pufferfish) hypothetical protein n=1 Tax=Tetraodon nigroviridis TaxID=99883 RepID=Q4SVU1_TETNG|nr:unnamed protein product [Tetraodon nigroviridis]